jgi:hypothetical protein
MLHCRYCSAFVSEFSMIDVVDRILSTYQSMCPLMRSEWPIQGKKSADILKASHLLASAI